MHKITDFIINILRWPAALYFVFSIPALISAYRYFNFYTFRFLTFGAGFVFFWITVILSGAGGRNAMQVISHELTHTFFAYLTLHKAGRIRLNPDGSGGSMQLNGYGNWLISLSPYFFPLFAFFYMLTMPYWVRVTDSHWLVYALLGYFFSLSLAGGFDAGTFETNRFKPRRVCLFRYDNCGSQFVYKWFCFSF